MLQGGMTDGKIWDEDLAMAASFEVVLEHAKKTLMQHPSVREPTMKLEEVCRSCPVTNLPQPSLILEQMLGVNLFWWVA